MNLFYYLLEANVYLLLIWAFYKFFTHQDTFYSLNRFYLVSGTLLSFLLPFANLSGLKAENEVQYGYVSMEEHQVPSWELTDYGLVIYIIVATVFCFKLSLNLIQIIKMIRSSTVIANDEYKVVLLKNDGQPFSFFNYMFLNPASHDKEAIIKHELTHIQQGHTFDIILIEFIRIINWMSPVTALILKELKSVHEFIADEAASKAESTVEDYALFLLSHAHSDTSHAITNQMFNSSLLKKRIIMLTKRKSTPVSRLKYALVIVMIMVTVCASALTFTKTYGIDFMPQSFSTIQDSLKKTVKKKLPPPPPVPPRPTEKSVSSAKESKLPPPVILEKRKVTGNSSSEPKVRNVKFPPPVLKPMPSGTNGSKGQTPPPAKPDKAPMQLKDVQIIKKITEITIDEPLKEIRIDEPGSGKQSLDKVILKEVRPSSQERNQKVVEGDPIKE